MDANVIRLGFLLYRFAVFVEPKTIVVDLMLLEMMRNTNEIGKTTIVSNFTGTAELFNKNWRLLFYPKNIK